jgi:endonuclease YncB( thermonuclease family)
MSLPAPRRWAMTTSLGGVVAVSLVLLVGVFVPSAAEAAPADPERGRGHVTKVLDGDTLLVRLDGASSDTRIRLIGINAPELGDCGADLATARLRQLVDGRRVTLHAANASSHASGRPLRTVRLPRSDGSSLDVNEQLLRDGMGVYFPLQREITDAARYQIAAEEARAAGRGIWRSDLCGQGRHHRHPIDIWVKSDADGNDGDNVNGEYVALVNRHTADAVDLTGWALRDSSLFVYRFPAGSRIAPGERLTVRVGTGTDSATTRYMGRTSPLFDNADLVSGMGDGAYLLDERGNVRGSFTYPCSTSCEAPLAGMLRIDAVEYDPPGVDTADNEWVRVRNVAKERIWLDGIQLRVRVHAHEFVTGTYLEPGERLTVRVGRGMDRRTTQYWGKDAPILRNAGDAAELLTFDERRIDCMSWAGGVCPATGPAVPRAANSCDGRSYAFTGDWDGSGRAGVGWWCDGSTRLRTSDGTVHDFVYGRRGDVPVVADWNGDGRATVSVIRDGTWHVNDQLRGGAASSTFHYGRVTRGDVPITGRWDRKARSLPGIIRDTEWHLRAQRSGGAADWQFTYGRLSRGDRPLVGDWNADGRDTVGIVRGGEWHLHDQLGGGVATRTYVYGRVAGGDRPVVGDWTGDGRATPGIVRSGQWLLKDTHGGGVADRTLGFPGV